MEDREIAERLRSGDERGMEALLGQYGPLLRYVVRPILPREEDREDCLSEVLMRIWDGIGGFDPARGSWRAYITAAARNAALNRARAARAAEALPDGPAAQPGPVGHTLVEHDSYGPRTVAFVHQPPGPQADIVLRRTIDRQPPLHEFGFDRRLDLQPVVQLPHGHHYRRHVVESVGPTAKHVQPDIDLAVGS